MSKMPPFCFPNLISTSFPQAMQRNFPFYAYGVKALHHDDRVDEFFLHFLFFAINIGITPFQLLIFYNLLQIPLKKKRDVPISDISFIIKVIITGTLIQQFVYEDAFYENDRHEFHLILLNRL